MNEETVIAQFDGMCIDMNYLLCIPSIHAIFRESEIIIDFCGGVRENINNFPEEKIILLKSWIEMHKDEIMQNHLNKGHSEPLNMIAPL